MKFENSDLLFLAPGIGYARQIYSWMCTSSEQAACTLSSASIHNHLCHLQCGRTDDEDEDLEELQQALLVLMARLETLAVSSAAGELMPALAPALAQSLADVSGQDAAPEDSAAVWECLSDLLCSPDPHAAQVRSHHKSLPDMPS